MALRPCTEGNNVDWIVQHTRHAPSGTVASLVPAGYEAYAQVLHAIHLIPGVESLAAVDFGGVSESRGAIDKLLSEMGATLPTGILSSRSRHGGSISGRSGPRVLWRHLAQHLGGDVPTPASFERDLWDLLDGDWPDELDGPTEGSLTLDEARALAAVLAPFTSEEVTFYYTWNYTKDFSGRCDVGSLSDLLAFFEMEEVTASPEYWWPGNRAWLVHTDIDLSYSLVAGSQQLIDSLTNRADLECLRLTSSARL